MQKLIKWCKDWWLSMASLGLLAFIPLYPKLPLVDIKNTWVYVRVEDFLVLFVLIGWAVSTVRNKRTLKSPLTLPILIFWLIGGIATLHSILLIVPTVYEIYPNVALLSYLRRIEYMSLFFVAYAASGSKRYVTGLIGTLVGTILGVSLYGIGQKYLGFPAFLTMNEEFAKGIPLTLSALSRVSSTFGGHYDLAAYLVLTLPIVVSLIFGYKNWWVRLFLGCVTALGCWVLVMTVSRISVFALFVAVGLVLFFQRRKLVLVIVPVALIAGLIGVAVAPNLLNRFISTVKRVDVLVDAHTGNPIGHVKVVPYTYFEHTTVRQLFFDSIDDVSTSASSSAKFIIPYKNLPPEMVLLTEPTAPTGEDLPSGTGYINLTLSPDVKRLDNFLYETKNESDATPREAYFINGEYLIKRASAYDLSFTTRFQGEWPKALAAFKRNIAIGSGYGSVSLAVDNSYLRTLGEVGVFGFAAFLAIFLMIGIYAQAIMPYVESSVVKSVVWGFIAGIVGLSINALFIDVFEASKVAFVLWILTGSILGVLGIYHRVTLRFFAEMKRIATSPVAIVLYVLIAIIFLFSNLTKNYFIGDDFTWLRWAASCESNVDSFKQCAPNFGRIASYFTQAEGFFWRPGTKIYFAFMYWLFWLNQNVYHSVSLALHFIVSICMFFVAKKVFKKLSLAAASVLLFVSLSGFSEMIFWISATGHLFTSMFMLLGLLSYIAWREQRGRAYFVGAILCNIGALMFYELGIVTPLLFVLYELTIFEKPMSIRELTRKWTYWLLLSPLPLYIIVRYIAHSHWFYGDYNYSLLKFPLNAVGNSIGYVLLSLVGPYADRIYQMIRAIMRQQLVFAIGVFGIGLGTGFMLFRNAWQRIELRERKIILFAIGFFVVSLLPFLGLGNIAPRYGYLASCGMVYLFVYLGSKLYEYLQKSGRDIAQVAITVIISIFVLVQSVGLHQLHSDWYEAGEMVRKFIVSMDSSYHDYWAKTPMEFHFVNVPIRHNEAWVFPVGISDALWFVFRNPDIKVDISNDVASSLETVTYGSATQKVFLFKDDGSLSEIEKPPPKIQ